LSCWLEFFSLAKRKKKEIKKKLEKQVDVEKFSFWQTIGEREEGEKSF
jgi:hypothetical protein